MELIQLRHKTENICEKTWFLISRLTRKIEINECFSNVAMIRYLSVMRNSSNTVLIFLFHMKKNFLCSDLCLKIPDAIWKLLLS